ncbi:30S ribosomal protein S11 [Candidatus Roizmanbacteria bacterium RIFCSPLOWO2_12_FULL_40_12]|uniref:Small ribosomal subunit protein uS11 n=1 Tax=Candidatus Roizmanbacteria bacterium RIFCSPLOWO2_01_FULL_40_42 TaxID=1802066 RepID=A0A1F7J4J6_9BACT|nr:MAG: 30S ribosomal protein S11 [Candidatus Roizmanbacteria bacterium RIFCSPHIGHO2_01_FULL_40_98]OGK27295.1 MAG: 30S ribosomal protein S11 [Candidatus Roizmanbacteria bacterium RIFCSPHIGHO2_02_FULL_40_53]OGK30833.1 MAG: 30S ribosomal protein S11 [Candidatus Roizmanbacteria bacterium RIFCSPHIGHO2_12_41_18]OGK36400.1 MAG: 30S ribosomal protein S11 [Candidatus Roizmanbacteria bacterium RIFCSPHIGHO2_12_FULL_40_130]OGK50528.1 MAG: 30S ribosomal protein S11 [Candidatus Roizmanbacteria bacterium RIF
MKKKKQAQTTEKGRIYITATFNNTMITVTDSAGNPIVLGSCGMHGFNGTRKSTPYAATITTEATLRKATHDHGMKEAVIYVKGIGPGREAALRVLRGTSIEVNKIIDITPVPHNGVRPPKIRRV